MLGAKGSTKLLPAGKDANSDVPYHSVVNLVEIETFSRIRIQPDLDAEKIIQDPGSS